MRKLAVLIVALAAAVLLFHSSGTDRLFNKLWIDRVPANPRSFVRGFLFWEDGFALADRSSAFRVELDILEFDHRDEFKVRYLQDNRIERWEVKTWACGPGEAPDPDFVHCMSIRREGVTTKYFAADDDDDEALERMKAYRRALGR